MNCFLVKLKWDFDGEERVDNVIIYGETYSHVVDKLTEYYTDSDILELSITYLNDMLFVIPEEDIERLKKFQQGY